MIKKSKYSDSISYKSYSKEVNHHKMMTTKREREIQALMVDPNTTEDEKNKLKNEVIEGHLKYVLQQANKYSGLGLELEDLIAEGNMGLMIAMESFDWSRGNKFITHASQWVRHEILDALYNNSRIVRLPVNIAQQLHREIKAVNDGKIEELSGEMANLPNTTDLHKVIGEDSSLLDIVQNVNALAPDAQIEYDYTVKYLLSKLDERSAKIIKLLFGIGGKEHDIKEVAEELDIHKETVRQIKIKALEKLERRFLPSIK
jgi:RNA polymerase sigma factor (sigma-70 family)